VSTDQKKPLRRVVERDGVMIMFGQRPFGNNKQAIARVGSGGFVEAEQKIVEFEKANGLTEYFDYKNAD
jgi:hypothetical protein